MTKLKNLYKFIGMLIFTCLIFSSYLVRHLASDSFIITRLGYKGYEINYSFLDGRPFMGGICFFADKLNIPILAFNRILLFLAIVVSVIAVIKLNNIVLKYKKLDSKIGKGLLFIACYYAIFHFFYLDNLYFAEAFVMAVSVLMYILAADLIVYNKKYIRALLLLIVGVMSYQATISMFFICVILLSMLKEYDYKSIFKTFCIAALLGFIAVASNLGEIAIIQKCFGITQTRISTNIFINIVVITFYLSRIILYTNNLLPAFVYITFILVIFIFVCYKTIKYDRNKHGEKIIIEQLILTILSILFSCIPSLISLSAMESGRLRFSIGATIGILFIHVIMKANLSNFKIRANKIIATILIVYAIINSANYIYLTILNGQVNELDKQSVYEIEEYIEEYEKNNNIQVKNIAIVYEKNYDKRFHNEFKGRKTGITVSALRTGWSVDGIINYYTERKLERKNVTEEENNSYIQVIDKENGYLCIGDTLYITVHLI